MPPRVNYLGNKINYLGHVVSSKGVSTDPKKIQAVVEWSKPTTVTEVRSFLGFISYYRRFIPKFSKIVKPLNQLLQNLEAISNQMKKFIVDWGQEQKQSFETLQKLCSEATILVYANFKALSYSILMLMKKDWEHQIHKEEIY